MDTEAIRDKARELRKDILEMNHAAGSGHPGGSLSAADIVACLFFGVMRLDPENPDWEDRDRFVLSKGHACPVLYAALAEKGFFSKEEYKTLRCAGGMLQGHPDRLKTPGVEFNSGSLGQGFSAAIGMALGARHTGKNFRVYALLGDGELNEGQVWEGFMFAAHHGLDNLTAIIDYNKLQSDDHNSNIMGLEPLADKLRAFNWEVLEVDGHDTGEILGALDTARSTRERPTMIIAHTVKGKGVSFMEGNPKWHGSLAPTDSELETALREIQGGRRC